MTEPHALALAIERAHAAEALLVEVRADRDRYRMALSAIAEIQSSGGFDASAALVRARQIARLALRAGAQA